MRIPSDSPAIQAQQLRRTFSSRQGSVEAVAGVDLEVGPGWIFRFLGPSGAGKTTTLRMLATLLPPTSGRATVAGADLRTQPTLVRRRIGYVGQNGGCDRSLSARAELIFQARLYGQSRPDARRRAAQLIDAFELQACADRPSESYSGGQRRRLDVALGLVNRPAVLFLDEPTTGLDPQSRAHLWEEVRQLKETGTTVFLTTHYLEEADALCDRLAIIDHGRIVAEGSPADLKREISGDVVTLAVRGDQHPAHDLLGRQPFVVRLDPLPAESDAVRLYVEHGESAMPAVFRILESAGLGLLTISLTRPSLDDVFLLQTGRSLREAA